MDAGRGRTLGGGLGGRRALLGLAIAAALPLAGIHALRWIAGLDARDAVPALLGVLLGALAADGITGLVHWACDTWGDEGTPWVGPALIRAFREHHRDPRAMLEHDWIEVNREPALASGVAWLLLLLPMAQRALDGHAFLYGFLWSSIAYAAAANQLHQWAHADRAPRFARAAQRWGLILSPQRHARHHRAPSTRAYCISTGWLNPALDGIGFWRLLECCISRLTGVAPRARRERVEWRA